LLRQKDNKFLDLAICGQVQYIITGDQDLLILNSFSGIYIINPKQFGTGIV